MLFITLFIVLVDSVILVVFSALHPYYIRSEKQRECMMARINLLYLLLACTKIPLMVLLFFMTYRIRDVPIPFHQVKRIALALQAIGVFSLTIGLIYVATGSATPVRNVSRF